MKGGKFGGSRCGKWNRRSEGCVCVVQKLRRIITCSSCVMTLSYSSYLRLGLIYFVHWSVCLHRHSVEKIRMAKTKESRDRQLNGGVGWDVGGGAVGADAHSNK